MQPRAPLAFQSPIQRAVACWGSVLLLVLVQSFAHTAHAQTSPGQAVSGPAQAKAQGGSIQGIVKSGNTPIPGATVTASNTLTGQKLTTWTNLAGQYTFQVPANGRYVIKVQMLAFAAITGEALINAATPTQRVDLELVLASRATTPADGSGPALSGAQRASTGTGRGYQSLSVQTGEGASSPGTDTAGSLDTPLAGVSANIATTSVSVAGNATASDFQSGFGGGFDDRREFNGGGGPGGPGGGGPGGGGPPGGFGGFRGFWRGEQFSGPF